MFGNHRVHTISLYCTQGWAVKAQLLGVLFWPGFHPQESQDKMSMTWSEEQGSFLFEKLSPYRSRTSTLQNSREAFQISKENPQQSDFWLANTKYRASEWFWALGSMHGKGLFLSRWLGHENLPKALSVDGFLPFKGPVSLGAWPKSGVSTLAMCFVIERKRDALKLKSRSQPRV